jgi:RHS repeat-associated protein
MVNVGHIMAGVKQRKFTGQEYDVDTGLSYMNARYYNGVIGRFISQDPLAIEALQTADNKKFQYLLANPQNWNTYSYALNNPLVVTDSSGLLTIYVPGTNYDLLGRYWNFL